MIYGDALNSALLGLRLIETDAYFEYVLLRSKNKIK
jgi:hypothetical protein